MALTKWNPFKGLMSVDQEIDWLFEEFLGRPALLALNGGIWGPPVDISETDDEVTVAVEIPGMSKEDVKVTLQDNILTIRGEKRMEMERNETNFHRVERSYSQQQSKIILLLTIFDYGSFVRSFSVPTGVLTDKIKAQYQDGLLEITFPKRNRLNPKKSRLLWRGVIGS